MSFKKASTADLCVSFTYRTLFEAYNCSEARGPRKEVQRMSSRFWAETLSIWRLVIARGWEGCVLLNDLVPALAIYHFPLGTRIPCSSKRGWVMLWPWKRPVRHYLGIELSNWVCMSAQSRSRVLLTWWSFVPVSVGEHPLFTGS